MYVWIADPYLVLPNTGADKQSILILPYSKLSNGLTDSRLDVEGVVMNQVALTMGYRAQ
jgi:hypothetical protein